MSENDSHEPVTVTDKRRIDPETGEVRETASGPAPSGPAPEPPTISVESQDQAAELIADLQRVQADFSNYRKRSLRDQQVATDRAKAPSCCRCSTTWIGPAPTATWKRGR